MSGHDITYTELLREERDWALSLFSDARPSFPLCQPVKQALTGSYEEYIQIAGSSKAGEDPTARIARIEQARSDGTLLGPTSPRGRFLTQLVEGYSGNARAKAHVALGAIAAFRSLTIPLTEHTHRSELDGHVGFGWLRAWLFEFGVSNGSAESS